MLYLRKIVPQCKVAQRACLQSTSSGHRMTFTWIGNYIISICLISLNVKNVLFLIFSRKQFLKVLRTQVPRDTFKCLLCKKAYPYKFLLTSHIKLSHSTMTYNCIYCSKVYKSNDSLQTHLKIKHTKHN